MGANIDPAQRLAELSRYQNAVNIADSFRSDGYMNMLTKVGTLQDNSTGWDYLAEPIVADQKLSSMYISNGLFAKIIDRPAEDAIAKGLDLSDLGEDLEKEVFTRLDVLKFNDAIITAEKWSRLYGGSLVVMLVDDGRGLDEPLDWKNITSIEELIPFERPLIQADTSDYIYSASFAEQHRKFGEPAFYDVYSQYGSFRVDASRCLVFRNGRVPESSRTAVYRHWGIPVYLKIKEALREAVTAHHDGTKLLERSVLGVYKMKNLSQLLATDEGEDKVIQRLQVIDMARNIINSMAIDVDGEDYQYINASMSGASDIIDRTCNMLSAVTDIPQTILFGKDPAGEDSTGDNDRDNYFQLLNRIQTNSYKDAAIKVVKIVLKAMVADGTQEDQIPQYEVRFNPMKQLSEEEQANIDSIKAGTEQTKASTAQIYVDMQALDPSEVRKGLANLEEYQIQGIVENDDLEIPEEAYDLRKQFAELNQIGGEGAENGNDPNGAEDDLQMNEDGGPGSGNWGHKGRPGIRGGSGVGGGLQYRYNTLQYKVYTSEAKAWAENKKKNKQAASGGGSSSTSGLKKALESGDSEQLVQAVRDAKPGQIVKYSNSIHSCDYMKMEDGSWLKLQDGYECSSDTLEKFAGSQTQKFSVSDIADQDFEACQKKFDKAMEVDHSAKKPGQDTYDKVLNTAHELPTGAKYESPDGEVFVKLADGSWEYDGYNVTEEDIAEHLTDTVHGGVAGFKKHAYGEQVSETSGSNSGSKKASSDTFDEEKYSQKRKDNATWNEPKQEIHDKLVENSGEEWKNATDAERQAIYDYTDFYYSKMNSILYRNDTSDALNKMYNGEKFKERINGATDYLDKCSIKTDVWAERGTSIKNAPNILGISKDELDRRLANNDFDDLIGSTTVQEGFLSTSPQKGASYGGSSNMVLNMYIPSGSHAAYAEPFSCHGAGAKKDWDGSKKTSNHGGFGEFELVVQRGSTFKITKIEVKDKKMYVDVDVSTADKSTLKTLD